VSEAPPSSEVLATFELSRLMQRAASERFEEVRCGYVAANGSLPAVWEASQVRVEPDREPPTLDELLELCELPSRWYRDLKHRYAFIADGPARRELAFSLARRGWDTKELALLISRRRPVRVPTAVRPLNGEAVRRLKGRLGVEHGLPPISAEQFDRYDRMRSQAAMRATMGGLDERGNPGALADLFIRGDIALIEDVATLRRRQGLDMGTAAVLAATAQAFDVGVRAVVLFAEPEVAQGFYAPLGFATIGGAWVCELPPAKHP